MNKRLLMAVLFSGLFHVLIFPIIADDNLALIPLELNGDEAYCTSLAGVIQGDLLLTLHLLDEYDILSISEEEWNDLGRKDIIEKYNIEQLISGKITAPAEGEVFISFQVFSPEKDVTSRELSLKAPGYMEIFEEIDSLVIEIVEECIQNRLFYGTLNITNTGSAPEYWISIDGKKVGKNIQKINTVPQGEHTLKIYTETSTNINLVDIYEFEMQREGNIDYEFNLNSDQELSSKKNRELTNGKTINMSGIIWRENNKTSQMKKSRKLRNAGWGLMIPGSIVTGLCITTLALSNITSLTQNVSESYTSGNFRASFTVSPLFLITGAAIGGAAVITGTILFISSFITREKELNREFAFTSTPIVAPNEQGTLTAGFAVSIKF